MNWNEFGVAICFTFFIGSIFMGGFYVGRMGCEMPPIQIITKPKIEVLVPKGPEPLIENKVYVPQTEIKALINVPKSPIEVKPHFKLYVPSGPIKPKEEFIPSEEERILPPPPEDS